MTKFQFNRIDDVEDTLLTSLDTKLIIHNDRTNDPNELLYFSNGNKLYINTQTGEILYDPIEAGSFSHSMICLRINQWFAKGLIREAQD